MNLLTERVRKYNGQKLGDIMIELFQATQFGAVLLALREGKCHFCDAPVEVRNNAAD